MITTSCVCVALFFGGWIAQVFAAMRAIRSSQ